MYRPARCSAMALEDFTSAFVFLNAVISPAVNTLRMNRSSVRGQTAGDWRAQMMRRMRSTRQMSVPMRKENGNGRADMNAAIGVCRRRRRPREFDRRRQSAWLSYPCPNHQEISTPTVINRIADSPNNHHQRHPSSNLTIILQEATPPHSEPTNDARAPPPAPPTMDITPLFRQLLASRGAPPRPPPPHDPARLNAFLQEAYRIHGHVADLARYLRRVRAPYLALPASSSRRRPQPHAAAAAGGAAPAGRPPPRRRRGRGA